MSQKPSALLRSDGIKNSHTDIKTYRLNCPRDPSSEKLPLQDIKSNSKQKNGLTFILGINPNDRVKVWCINVLLKLLKCVNNRNDTNRL